MENPYLKPFFSRFLRILLKTLFLVILIFVFFWIGGEKIVENKIKNFVKKNILQERVQETIKLPEPTNPKTVNYQWKYNGKSYELEETLYESYYNFYASSPKTYSYSEGELPQNWEEKYFQMFLDHPSEDKTLSEIAEKLKDLGIKNKLGDDQIVELVLSFVQNIPYDNIKAKRILFGNEMDPSAAPDYPYEVLYTKTGVCSDKSILAYSLLTELGYGASFFIYNEANHMAIGIKCPENYSNYDSGYCYAETTSLGNKIGLIPELDTINNVATSVKEIEYFDKNSSSSSNSKELGQVNIMNRTDGEEYQGIVKTIQTQKKINDLKTFLNKERSSLTSLKSELSESLNEIKDLKNKLDNLMKKKDYDTYNDLVPKYNKLVSGYKDDSENYNDRVNEYNEKVNEYNNLIKSFY